MQALLLDCSHIESLFYALNHTLVCFGVPAPENDEFRGRRYQGEENQTHSHVAGGDANAKNTNLTLRQTPRYDPSLLGHHPWLAIYDAGVAPAGEDRAVKEEFT